MSTAKPRLFYGWVIVAAGFIMAAVSIGIFNNCLSVFVKPVSEALGFSRGSFTLYNTVRSITSMLMMPVFGELFQRGRGIKLIMVGCAVLVGAASVGYSFSSALWQFYLFALLQGLALNGIFLMAISTTINNWFKAKKGIAMGLALSGSGFGGAIMVPVISYIIENLGWRWGYRAMTIIGLSILLPVIILIIRIRPADMGLLPYGAEEAPAGAMPEADAIGFTRAEVVRMPGFYCFIGGFFLAVFVFCSMQAHAAAYLTDLGHSGLLTSSVLSVCMFVLIFGKIVMGWILDRFGARAGSLTMALTAATACVCLIFAQSVLFAYAFAACMGFSMSFGSVSPSLITSRYFGSKDFARILALISMGDGLGNAVSQPFPGFIYDFTGSYRPAWFLCLGFILIAALMLLLSDRLIKREWEAKTEAEATL